MFFDDVAAVGEADLERLITNKVQEGLDLEFKRELNLTRNDDKRELARDVSAMANGVGGQLLYGIDEGEQPDGTKTATKVTPLTQPNLDQVASDILNSTVSPRVSPRMVSVPIAAGGHVLIVDVPPSLGDLHMVSGYGEFRYYRRTAKGRTPMTEPEVREHYARITAQRAGLEARLNELIDSEVTLRHNIDESIIVAPWYGQRNLLDPRKVLSVKERVAPAIEGSDLLELFDGMVLRADGFRNWMQKGDRQESTPWYVAARPNGVVHVSSNVALQEDGEQHVWWPIEALHRVAVTLLVARELYRAVGYMEKVRLLYVLRSRNEMALAPPDIPWSNERGHILEPGVYRFGPFDVPWRELEDGLRMAVKEVMDAVYQARGQTTCPHLTPEGKLSEATQRRFQLWAPFLRRAFM